MPKSYKEIILGAAVVLLGVFCWYFLKYVFYIGNLTIECWIGGVIIFILWGIALCLAMLLIKDIRILYGAFLITLCFFGLFFNNEPFYYLIGLIIFFFAFWVAAKKMKKEEEVQVNLNFWRIWKRGLPMLITALILVISLVYYFSPELMNKKDIRINIPKNVFNTILKPIESLIQEKLSEGVNLNSDVDKILQPKQKQDLEKQFGIKINSGETGRDVLYKLVDYQLNNIAGPYGYLVPLGLAIGLFITLKIVSILYVAIVIMFSWLTLKLLIVLKFVKVEIETKEVETVKL